MRILFFTDHFWPEPSAPAAHVLDRARLWVRWGHQVTVLCAAPNFPEGKVYPGYANAWRRVESLDGIRVVRVKTFIAANEGVFLRALDYCSYALSSFFFSLWEARPEVIISTSPHLLVPIAGVACALARGVPHVFEIRDLWPASIVSTTGMGKGAVYRLLERLELALYRRSARILSLTERFRQDLRGRGVAERKIDVVVNGANLEIFSPRERDPELLRDLGLEGRFVLGYLGTIGLAHGLEGVIAAAALLRDSPVSFLFVGVGAARDSLQVAARERKLTNVLFVPRQLRERMPSYWSLCDLGLIHLRDSPVFETVIPSKIFESMAMGKPILYAGPAGEGSALVEKHGAGVAIPSGRPRLLADTVLDLLQDEPRRIKMSAQALAAAPLFSRDRQARESLQVLQRAIEA